MSGAGAREHDPLVAIVSAIIAVLAALGTLASHHRSIEALATKNQAILTTAKASDQFTSYQTKRVRVAVYSTLLAGDVITNPKARSDAKTALDHEQASSLAVLGEAKRLETRAEKEQETSERMMSSYVTLEIGTTLFEIAIVLTSISALTETRILLWFALGMAVIGIVLLPIGYFAH
ncbi:MAG TPA: DUF4337 family protein [Candidatus Aquilonibacter sp.]|nr:DUF4337 family protein [Candidatus Aquilonibacter sp.]